MKQRQPRRQHRRLQRLPREHRHSGRKRRAGLPVQMCHTIRQLWPASTRRGEPRCHRSEVRCPTPHSHSCRRTCMSARWLLLRSLGHGKPDRLACLAGGRLPRRQLHPSGRRISPTTRRTRRFRSALACSRRGTRQHPRASARAAPAPQPPPRAAHRAAAARARTQPSTSRSAAVHWQGAGTAALAHWRVPRASPLARAPADGAALQGAHRALRCCVLATAHWLRFAEFRLRRSGCVRRRWLSPPTAMLVAGSR